jgi:hypothetical protein
VYTVIVIVRCQNMSLTIRGHIPEVKHHALDWLIDYLQFFTSRIFHK